MCGAFAARVCYIFHNAASCKWASEADQSASSGLVSVYNLSACDSEHSVDHTLVICRQIPTPHRLHTRTNPSRMQEAAGNDRVTQVYAKLSFSPEMAGHDQWSFEATGAHLHADPRGLPRVAHLSP